jgi:squalene-hopene/tetraprenyl-beta-curcumene cyclase
VNRTAPKPTPFPAELPNARSDIVSHTLKRIADSSPLDRAIGAARDALIAQQNEKGYWLYELEADCTIPAEYIMMMHFLDEIDAGLESKLANHLRACQAEHGGWPLYHNGELDLSCTVKAYYALKLAGDDCQAPHMAKARAAILARGGAARANVFTRIALALFGELPWRGIPYIPVEIMLLPKWFPFHINKVSYWSRAVMVPLFILCTRKPKAKNPRNIGIRELFTTPPEKERHYFQRSGMLAKAFLLFDHVGRMIDPLIPARIREHATRRAETWVLERGWTGRDFPGHGQCLGSHGDSGLPAGPPAAGHRQACPAETSGGGSFQRLLPTLCVADLGYGARLPGDAGGGR